tara:strand:- start:451 stop:765 length:315 start_codon:yes stop_codon:yes gene_type:complete
MKDRISDDFSDHRRLDRIEEKIDRLSEVVVLLARAEERLVSLENAKIDNTDIIRELDRRTDRLENLVGINTRTVDSVHKLAWAGITAIVTAFIAYIVTQSTKVI